MRAALVIAVVSVSAARADAPRGAVAVLDRPAATVGNTVIWESQVDGKLIGHKLAKDARSHAIDELIDEVIYLRRAREISITVDKSEVIAALDEIKQQNNLDDAGLDAALKANGYTRARYMVDLEHQLLILRVRNQDLIVAAVTDADVEAEAKARDMKGPLSTADSDKLRQELRRRRLDAAAPIWTANLRKRFRIEKFP